MQSGDVDPRDPKENIKLKDIKLKPVRCQGRHLTEASLEEAVSNICVRITISICAGGATVGFCLLVAGGIGLNLLGNSKVLMYVGIVMFLVCLILIVILCSSLDVCTLVPVMEREDLGPDEDCTQSFINLKHCDQEYGVQYVFPHTCHLITPEEDHGGCNLRKLETANCTVKNCVCRHRENLPIDHFNPKYSNDIKHNSFNYCMCQNPLLHYQLYEEIHPQIHLSRKIP
ncbi:UNVERIFIED_CONTAM: hypothetical protein RMT77_007092 [Armadillidium vulgare]